MNTVRRDHSISPIDRSNTRIAAYTKPETSGRVDGASAMAQLFTRYLNTACRLSSGDVTSSTAPLAPGRDQLGEPRVELVGLAGFDDDGAGLEAQADDVGARQELAREAARDPSARM